MHAAWPILTTLLTTAGVGILLALRFIGLYNHQSLSLVLLLGIVGGLLTRLWKWRKGTLHGRLARHHKAHLFQAAGRAFFFTMVGGTALAIFPRTNDMLGLMVVLGIATLVGAALQLVQPARTNRGPTVVMLVAGLMIATDLIQALRPTASPVVTLEAPFHGEWVVLQGGRSPLQSHHLIAYNQTHAMDLVRLEDGRIFNEGDGNAATNAWEAPLFAPIAGTVVQVRGDMEDSVGLHLVTDMADALGNHVVIQTEDGHYVVFAHLRQGTLAVESGQQVEVGTPLGKTGNSGNTTMPHLHVQVQTHADLWDPDNRSVPFTFQDGVSHRRNDRIQGRDS